MTFKCCVLGCKYEGQNGLHSFPSDQAVAAKWIQVAQVKKPDLLIDRSKNKKLSHSFYHICKKHFKPSDYVTNGNNDKRLKKGAIPSQCLPNMLLSIEREHDYTPVPSKRIRLQDVVFDTIEATIGATNHNNADDNNNPPSFFADVLSFAEIGANADVLLDESLDTQLEESKKTQEGIEKDAVFNHENNKSEAKCEYLEAETLV